MKHFFYISFISLLFSTCQKANRQTSDGFAGKWNFEVKYQNKNTHSETKLRYEGHVTNSKNELMFFYGFNDFVNATVNSDGVLHNTTGELIGVIEPETCILNFKKDKYNIKVEGFKKV